MKKVVLGICIGILLLLGVNAVLPIQSAANTTSSEALAEKTTPLKNETNKEATTLETTTKESNTKKTATKRRVNDYNVYSYQLPSSLNFAGEQVPMTDPDVYERMDREFLVNTYWQSNGILLIKRAHKYFPIIEPILKKNGIPDDFKYLAIIESGLQQVRSPAGAAGFWQIMKGTGREYGLEVNNNVDERYHIAKATQVACDYLKASKARFGSWTLAAAAYNAGNAGINRVLESQGVDSYYDLYLNPETGRYVYRILALKTILKDPTDFGFNVQYDHKYNLQPTKKVAVDFELPDLVAFAKQYQITYKELKLYNPWLREPKLNNKSRKTYYFKIPLK